MIHLAIKSSEVREKFSEFIDNVIYQSPKIVNRRRDNFLAINTEHLLPLVEHVRLHVNLEQDEDGKFISSFDEIPDLLGYGESVQESLDELVKDLVEYAHDYLTESFSLYMKAPNRKEHFPYVLKVMMQSDLEQIMKFIHVKH